MTRRSDALHHTWRTVPLAVPVLLTAVASLLPRPQQAVAAAASAPAGTVATATNCSVITC